jgi:hypothetical protein
MALELKPRRGCCCPWRERVGLWASPERSNNVPVDKPFPGPDHFVDGRPPAGVRRPTLLNEPPHLRGKSKLFGSLGFGRSPPVGHLNDDRPIGHIGERDLAGEHFHGKHCERENVTRLGRGHLFGSGFLGRLNDLRGEPPRGSCGSRCCSSCEGWVRSYGSEAVIADLGYSGCGYYDVGLNRFCHQYGLDLG